MKYKVGDKVKCITIPESAKLSRPFDSIGGGGAGWILDKEFTVRDISHPANNDCVLWIEGEGKGVYSDCVLLVPENINDYELTF